MHENSWDSHEILQASLDIIRSNFLPSQNTEPIFQGTWESQSLPAFEIGYLGLHTEAMILYMSINMSIGMSNEAQDRF